jgi:Hypervirulence associated proteins TUDOR domain
MANDEIEKGDKGNPNHPHNRIAHQLTQLTFCATVSWNWGSGQPSGKVAETKTEGEVAIKSKRGNTIKKNASPSNPAVHVSRSGNDVVKRASELTVDEKASGSGSAAKKSKSPAPKENGDKKREHEDEEADADEGAEAKADEEKEEKAEKEVKKPAAKKQKKEPAASKKKKAVAEKAAPAEKEKKQANGGDEAKKGRGRPKGTAGTVAGSAGGKKKKAPKPRATEGIGSRTRSRA